MSKKKNKNKKPLIDFFKDAMSDPFLNVLIEGESDAELMEHIKTIKEIKEPFQTHCTRIIHMKDDYVAKICGKSIEDGIVFKNNDLFYEVDLCKEHFNELVKKEKERKEKELAKEKERKEKETKDFIETDMICPHCGKKVFKHWHRYDNYLSRTIEYRWFWCWCMGDLGCGCCALVDTHGDCCANFCINKSAWEPRKKMV